MHRGISSQLIGHCENRGDRFKWQELDVRVGSVVAPLPF